MVSEFSPAGDQPRAIAELHREVARLHDIGMVYVPREVATTPHDQLDDELAVVVENHRSVLEGGAPGAILFDLIRGRVTAGRRSGTELAIASIYRSEQAEDSAPFAHLVEGSPFEALAATRVGQFLAARGLPRLWSQLSALA